MLNVAGALVAVALLTAMVFRAWPWINAVETGNTPEYPDLVPRTYVATPEHVMDAALHAISRLSRWTLIAAHPERGEIDAEARTKVWRFVDDVHIDVRPGKTGRTRTTVDVRSSSRVGQADFGQNARNVRKFFEALDRELSDQIDLH